VGESGDGEKCARMDIEKGKEILKSEGPSPRSMNARLKKGGPFISHLGERESSKDRKCKSSLV